MKPSFAYKMIIVCTVFIFDNLVSFSQGKLISNGATINVTNSAFITTYDLSLNGSSMLKITNSTLRVADSIHSNANIDLRHGTLEMYGGNGQSLPVASFQNNAVNNLIVSNTNPAGVSIGGALDVYGSLTYSGSGMKLTTNDNLTFKSTATGTAWVGNMTGNTITGKVTVERYISARKAWRFLSIPTNTIQTVRQTWQEGAASTSSNPVGGYGIQITGPGGTAAGFDLYSAAPSMKTYNPANKTWVGISNTANSIRGTDGYMIFIRGDRTANSVNSIPTPTTLRTKGILYTGNQLPIAVGSGMLAALGNPYAAALDMRNITKTGLKDFFYVWDPAIAGTYGYGGYQTFSNNGSGNYIIIPGGGSYGPNGSVSNYIQSGLAFFVQGGPGGGSLTFTENAKATGSSLASVPNSPPYPSLRVTLSGLNADNSTYTADGLLVNYGDNFSNRLDDMDALKLTNSSENLAIKRNDTLLAVERRHTINRQDTILFNLTGVNIRNYSFDIAIDGLYKPGLGGFLQDNYLHVITPLNVDGTTHVDFPVANVAGSYAANRFMIVFSQLSTLPVTFTDVKALLQDHKIYITWKVDNEMNIEKYEVEKSTDGNTYSILTTTPAKDNNGRSSSYIATDDQPAEGYNYYRIRSVDKDKKTAYSDVVKSFVAVGSEAITVSPNPVINNNIELQFINQPAGVYKITLFDNDGRQILQQMAEHEAGSSSSRIRLERNLPKGVYQLKVIKPDHKTEIIKLIF